MERKWIVRLLKAALGLHMLYFLFLALFVILQRQIEELYLPGSTEPYNISAFFLLAGSTVYLVLHCVLTVILEKRMDKKSNSVSAEMAAALLFGGAFPLLHTIGQFIAISVINHLGISATMSYSVFMRAAASINPVRDIAISLLLLTIGMASCYKRSHCKQDPENEKRIVGLFKGSLGFSMAYFLIMILIVIFQNQIKSITNSPCMDFVVPVVSVAKGIGLLAMNLFFVILLTGRLRRGDKGILWELLGFLLFSGMLEWPMHCAEYVSTIYTARSGPEALANLGAVNESIHLFSPVYAIGINLFIIACGMIIIKKLSLPNDIHGIFWK